MRNWHVAQHKAPEVTSHYIEHTKGQHRVGDPRSNRSKENSKLFPDLLLGQ